MIFRAGDAPKYESESPDRAIASSAGLIGIGATLVEERDRSTFRLVGLGLLLLLLGGVAFGAWRHHKLDRQVALVSEERRSHVPLVSVYTVKKTVEVVAVSFPATIEAFESANIYARASGYISKRYVDIGSRVRQGDKLAEISAPELDDQIAEAEAVLAQAEASERQTEANRELARVTNSRTRLLAAKGWATKQQGDVDRLNYIAQQHATQAGTANVKTQRAQINVLRQRKAYLLVLAPFDGVVTQRNVDVGSLVQADTTSGTFMFTTMRGEVVRIQTYIPQDQAFALAPGVDAVVKVSEIPGRAFSGKVTRIANALQPATRTLLTEVDVQNPEGALVPGSYCTVELRIPRKFPSFLVPADAIIFNQGGIQVALVQNGVVRLRSIAIARDLGTEVELNAGVTDGDTVIVSPPVDLQDGQNVGVRHAPARATP
jgi:RND family efflux transporter MFP subunit